MIEYKKFPIEKILFYVILLSNVVLVFATRYFPALDSPSHLYNAQIIKELLFHKQSTLDLFFNINTTPIPNWTGHLLLTLLSTIMPMFIAEKIVLLLYVIGLPLAFRNLLKTINSQNSLFVYFIFPLTFSLVFFLGFYNFCLALVFLFLALAYWIKFENKKWGIKTYVISSLLLLLLYFTHLFVFTILLIFIGLRITFFAFLQFQDSSISSKKIFLDSFSKSSKLIIIGLVPICFAIWYYITHPSLVNLQYISKNELLHWFKNIRPLIVFGFDYEELYTKMLFYCFASVILIGGYFRITRFKIMRTGSFLKNVKMNFIHFFEPADYWIVVFLVVLVMLFILPNANQYAGYVSFRIMLLFFMFLIVWFSTQKFSKWFKIIVIGIILFCHFSLNTYYTKIVTQKYSIVKQCIDAASHIKKYSVVLPISIYSDWAVEHYSNYLGAEKPIVILDNYECGTGYFPVKWNYDSIPKLLIGNQCTTNFPCLKTQFNTKNHSYTIDYIFLFGNEPPHNDLCYDTLIQTVTTNYKLVFESQNVKLYKIN